MRWGSVEGEYRFLFRTSYLVTLGAGGGVGWGGGTYALLANNRSLALGHEEFGASVGLWR